MEQKRRLTKEQNQRYRRYRKAIRGDEQSTGNFQRLIQNKLEAFNAEGTSAEWKAAQDAIFNEAKDQHETTPEDQMYLNNLRNLIRKKREENKDGVVYWNNDYIDQIGLPEKPKFIFIKGGKNIGKTYGIATFLERELARDPKAQVMLLRTTMLEINAGFEIQLMGDEWPFYMSGAKRNLIRKPGRLLERGPSLKKPNKKGRKNLLKQIEEGKGDTEEAAKQLEEEINFPDICGFATYANGNGFAAYQGSSWKNMKHVIWDECNDTGALTPKVLNKFVIFLLSMERNNKDIRVWVYGNLLRREDGSASDIMLDFLKIPYETQLKFFRTTNGTPCLYLNTGEAGDMFDGVNTQSFTDIFGLGVAADLESNMPLSPNKVLSKGAFLHATPVFSFVVEMDNKLIIVYLGYLDYSGVEGNYYCLHWDYLTTSWHLPGYLPVSSFMSAVNCFNCINYKKPKRIAKLVKKIRKIERRKQLFYSADDVRMEWFKIEKRLVSIYSKELDGDI